MEQEPLRLKRRTRQHVIADLGVNFVERIVLLSGYVANRFTHDYGIDLTMKTFTLDGEVEPGNLALQVKATDHFAPHADQLTFPFRVETIDLRTWLIEWEPVILLVYDATGDRAYWVNVHQYARDNSLDEDVGGETVTLRIPIGNTFNGAAVQHLRSIKEQAAKNRRPGRSS